MLPILPANRPRLARELKEMLRLALPLVTGQLSAIGMCWPIAPAMKRAVIGVPS